MKRLKKLFACFLVVLMVITTSAVSVSAAPIVNTKVIDGISFVLATPGGGSYSDTRYWDKSIDGRKAYCVEPGVMDLSNDYNGAVIDDERYVRASLADYWGRACQGNSAVSQFYVQIYTWEMLGCSLQSLSDPSGGGRVSMEHYNSWKAGIQPAIDAYFKVPSFAGKTYTIVIRNTETLTDSNGVLSYYNLVNNPTDVTVSQSGNTLKLTAPASARTEGAIKFAYSIDGAYETPCMYWNAASSTEQDCMTVGVGTLRTFNVNVKIDRTGKCKIIKTAEDNQVAGLQFRITGTGYDKTVTIGSDGTALAEGLEEGTYTVTELTPVRYVAPASQTVKIEAGKTASVSFDNILKKFRVTVKKADAETTVAQGGASLEGAVYGMYKDGTLHKQYTTSATGEFTTDYEICGPGWTIKEISPSPGYLLDPTVYELAEAYPDHYTVELNTFGKGVTETVIRGGVRIEKWDNELDSKTPQGDGSLAGAVFEIYNRNSGPVVVGGVKYDPNAAVHTMTTDASGVAQTAADLLPFGTFEIIEKTPPVAGYLGTGVLKQTFKIVNHLEIVNLNRSGTVIKNNPVRGGVRIEKWDNEIDANKAQGGATLEGAVFQIYNRSKASVMVGGTLYAPGALVHTMSTDAGGVAQTAADLLPYGTYEAIESSPPLRGYLHTGVLKRTFTIREDGVIVNLNTSETAIKNNPIRGDLEGVKISENMERLSNVPFRITSKTTGESHVIVTDENGYFNTASSWNLHSYNTNQGKTEFDGIWFGDINTLNDSLGALLYDTYIIEELPCFANMFHELTPPFEVKVSRNNTVVKLGSITNFYEMPPEIGTTAVDQESGTHTAIIGMNTTIVDTVAYSGLKVGQEYTLEGILMDKATGEPLLIDGKEVTGSTAFTAESAEGTVDVEFTFPSIGLQGRSVVVFETLCVEGKEVTAHADIEDEGQTVTFIPPEIGTTAVEQKSGSHVTQAGGEVTIVDTVAYTGLEVGEEYTVEGVLMDKSTGKPLLIDGEEVTGSATFTAESKDGTAEVEFTFDTTGLQGISVVVFETLYIDSIELAVHADIEDEGQTVTFETPEIGTTAIDKDSGTHTANVGKMTTIVDTVEYSGLKVDQEYTIEGVLMVKETGEPLMIGGKAVTSSLVFVAESSIGAVELEFTFDSSALQGQVIVVFETLYQDDIEIATHTDINDFDQSVAFEVPFIGTTAKDSATESSHAYAGKETSIIDTVQYTGLKEGAEYTIKGVLMDKSTGKPLLVDGKEVTAETTFVAESVDGIVDVTFKFNSAGLAGKDLVVFEKLYSGDEEIAAHKDIEDAGQTIHFINPKISTSATDSVTGTRKADVSQQTTIIDKVTFKGLIVGDEYTVKGVLMDKSTGKPLLVNGKEVTASTTFTAKRTDGFVELRFTFDSSALYGKEVVVFERLYYGQKEIAVHTDINDVNQTVTFNPAPEPVTPTNVPKTGDSYGVILWAVLFGIGILGLGTLLVLSVRQGKKRKNSPPKPKLPEAETENTQDAE